MPYYASFFHLFLLHQYFIRTGHSFSFSSSTDSSITRTMAIIETTESQSYNLRPYDPTRGSDITALKEICVTQYPPDVSIGHRQISIYFNFRHNHIYHI